MHTGKEEKNCWHTTPIGKRQNVNINRHLRWKDEIYLLIMPARIFFVHFSASNNLPTWSSVCNKKKINFFDLLFICFNKRFHLHLNRTPNQFMIFHIFACWTKQNHKSGRKKLSAFFLCLFDIKSPIKSHLLFGSGLTAQVIFQLIFCRFRQHLFFSLWYAAHFFLTTW